MLIQQTFGDAGVNNYILKVLKVYHSIEKCIAVQYCNQRQLVYGDSLQQPRMHRKS